MARKKGVPNVKKSRSADPTPPVTPPPGLLATTATAGTTGQAAPPPLPPPTVLFSTGAIPAVFNGHHVPPVTNGHGPAGANLKEDGPPGLNAMDRFAEIYVPQWLRQVNVATPLGVITRSAAETEININYEALLDEVYPRRLVFSMLDVEHRCRAAIQAKLIPVTPPIVVPQTASARIVPTRPGEVKKPVEAPVVPAPFSLERQLRTKLPALTPSTYAEYWVPLQQSELLARTKQLDRAALYAVPLYRAPVPPIAPGTAPSKPPAPILYVLSAPSIREGWPPVDLGDVLNLRQLLPNVQRWQGLLLEASVCGINRAKGEVILRCDMLPMYEQSMIFNITWRVQDRVFFNWRRSTETLHYALTRAWPTLPDDEPETRRTTVEKWLFPLPEDVSNASDADIEVANDWEGVDKSLNEEQRNAVQSILWGKHKVPFLISGPPGTGKTKTLVEAVLQLLKKYPHTHILVAGASPPSADTLAMRLRSLAPSELLRLNPPNRPFTEVPVQLLPYSHVEGDRFTLPSMATLLSKRVIVCSLLDASLLLTARCSNHDISTLYLHTLGTLNPSSPVPIAQPHFGFLLVDEAAQASEADASCALSIVATDPLRCHPAHVTLCGDVHQLGPVIISPEARGVGLDVSLSERLAEREVYAEHPFARKYRTRNPDLRWKLGTPFVPLVKNYRSHPSILMLPSTLFYNETLEPYAPASVHNSDLQRYHGLPKPGFPVMFHGVTGDDFPIDEGASFYNELEIATVVQHVVRLVGEGTPHGTLRAKEISVISPFREQVWRIRLALRGLGLHDVDVGNVEALQGAENRAVIISTVRSKEVRWLRTDRELNRGLIHEHKRFNVAMTRAKELLIVVGNPITLCLDNVWLSFYYFCRRNECYTGVPFDYSEDESSGAQAVSKLEMEWHARRRSEEGDERPKKEREDSEFDLLVGRIVGSTFEE